MQRKYLLIVITMFLVSNIFQSVLLVSLSNRGQKQRLATQEIVRRFECLLLVQPAQRDKAARVKCADEARRETY